MPAQLPCPIVSVYPKPLTSSPFSFWPPLPKFSPFMQPPVAEVTPKALNKQSVTLCEVMPLPAQTAAYLLGLISEFSGITNVQGSKQPWLSGISRLTRHLRT
ncbi:hypothetical protein OGATHE_001731 [Ogataea polymorpha]|uniref:Uncharacterized protein n=1 Tax=Ogataea polymorpha TaxID=460523 RepID=A0A9P8TDY5_9ASCO|nr:hypothetical protein OGATHE_001731 [Ogataea polymorpha]